MEKDKLHFFFHHEDGRTATDENDKLDAELERWLQDMQKASEQKEDMKRGLGMVDDNNGRAGKRAKHNPPA